MAGQLVENFTLDEMNIHKLDEILPEIVIFAQLMQELRSWYRKPIIVNSWLRSPGQNKSCGGDPRSAHLDARAVDCRLVASNDMIYAWKAICEKHGYVGGVNRYDTFTHFTNHEDKFGHKTFIIRDYRRKK